MINTAIPAIITKNNGDEVFKAIISEVKLLKDLSNPTALCNYLKIWNTAFHQLYPATNILESVWFDNGSTDLITDLIVKINKIGFFKSDEYWFPAYHCMNILWNFSDISIKICTSLLDKKEFIDIIIFNSTHQPYIDKVSLKNIHFLIKTSVSVIHNIARFHGYEVIFKQHKELKSSLIKLIRYNDADYMGIISTLTLSMLVEENELELLEECKKTIKTLCTKIRLCLSNVTGRTNGFSMWELLNGLRKISVNDNMKREIENQKGLELLLEILKRPTYTDLDAEMTLGTLWNLCFDKEIRDKLNSDKYKLKEVLDKFKSHSNESIKKAYVGIMWLLDQKKQKDRVKSAAAFRSQHKEEEKWKYDFFISYSWANKLVVYKIRDEIKKINSKLRIWLDVDQMQGSTIEAMATGIEQSRVFVMFASEAYRTSPNCRTEAEYAFSLKQKIVPVIVELRYKPTGWLGFIIGSKTYFEFSERRDFATSLSGLYKSIMSDDGDGQMAEQQSTLVNEPIIQESHQAPLGSATGRDVVDLGGNNYVGDARKPKMSDSIKSWTKADVNKWFIDTKQSKLKAKLGNVARLDGRFLYALITMSYRAPDYLFTTFKSEYGLNLVDVVDFNVAVDELQK